MKKNNLQIILAATFAWVLTLLAGSLLFDTFVLYPNIFYDVPASLEAATQFLRHGSPGKFFPPLGAAIILLGIVSIIVNRRNKTLLISCTISFVLIVAGEFAFSAYFFWPKNEIMFVAGAKVHTTEVLKSTAEAFRKLHWVRLLISILASFVAMAGLVKNLTTK
jgi:hypothetical protein